MRMSAGKVDGASAAYSAQEQRAYEAAAAAMQRIGVSLAPFSDPRANAPTLPAASGGAPSGHGDAEPWLLQQAADDGRSAAQFTRDAYDDITGAANSWGAPTGIVERQDPTSYLVPPNANKSEIESMRWGAGPLLGGVDWVFEQIAGFSLLEDVIMKPFAGNWTGIEEVSLAWEYLGEASRAVADNCAGLAEQGRFWDGSAGLAFRGGMVAIGTTFFGVGAACDQVSSVVGTLLLVSKAAAAAIGFLLNKLSVKLLRMAAEAAVPVAGWLVMAAEIAVLVTEIFGYVRLIYTIVDTLFDAIESTLEARAQVLETALLVEDLLQTLVDAGTRVGR
jgi:hypothetical protein